MNYSKEQITNIESRIFNEVDISVGNSFLKKGLSPIERIIEYDKSPKVAFQYICSLHKQLSFEAGAAQVTLLPENREELLIAGKEMLEHGVQTGRFKNV